MTKLPDKIDCVMSMMLAECSDKKLVTLATMPTLSEPTTVIIAFIFAIIVKMR